MSLIMKSKNPNCWEPLCTDHYQTLWRLTMFLRSSTCFSLMALFRYRHQQNTIVKYEMNLQLFQTENLGFPSTELINKEVFDISFLFREGLILLMEHWSGQKKVFLNCIIRVMRCIHPSMRPLVKGKMKWQLMRKICGQPIWRSKN